MRTILFFAALMITSIMVSSITYADEHKSEDAAYQHPPVEAARLNDHLVFVILEEPTVESERKEIVRSYTDIWNDDGEQLFNAEEDGLNASRPEDLRSQFPYLADALAATPDGAKYRWWIDADGVPDIEQGLPSDNYMIDIRVRDSIDATPAPDNVGSIPSDAIMTPGGVGYMTLRSSDSEVHPTLQDMIECHIIGWQANGTMFYNTYIQESPATFPLGALIAGWQDAIPHMVVGEKARIWIPGELAYDNRADRPHAPKGMLVFDVELLSIPGPAPGQE